MENLGLYDDENGRGMDEDDEEYSDQDQED